MNRPILKRRSDASDISVYFSACIIKILQIKDYSEASEFATSLRSYWYGQVKKNGWRRLSGKRIEELCKKEIS